LTARTVIVLLPTLTGDEPVWLTLVGQRALRGEDEQLGELRHIAGAAA
jgi:hypothetical protein